MGYGILLVFYAIVVIGLVVGYVAFGNKRKSTFDKTNEASPSSPPSSVPAFTDDYNAADPDNEFDDAKADRSPPARVVGYYTNWARYREDLPCLPKDLPTDSLTDIVYAFFPINDDGLVKYSDPWSDINLGGIKDTVALRGRGRVSRVLFSIGGWTYSGPETRKCFDDENAKGVENTKPFQTIWNEILRTKEKRAAFIDSAIVMMNRHNFDGIDIDYEYPACPQGDCKPEYEQQPDRFLSLLRELRSKLGNRKLITLATAAADKNIAAGPNMKLVSEIVDYLNVMTYDYYVWLEGGTSGHNQPKRLVTDKERFCVNHTMWRYLKAGCDPKKLNVGAACYGRGYKISAESLQNAVKTRKFDEIVSVDGSHSTKWIQQPGVAAFFEFASEFPHAKSMYVKNQGSWLYDTNSNEIMSYIDLLDMRSLNEIRIRKKIGGVLFYAVDQDDYNNLNGFGKYPLLRNFLKIEQLKPKVNMIA